jgi:heat-inducible transcriptional repressor
MRMCWRSSEESVRWGDATDKALSTMASLITNRQQQILRAVVESYIASGEPVSSAAVARALGEAGGTVSSATVRNEMADLTDAGLLEQPHTSAGRVPSAQAFRLYVQELTATAGSMASGDRMLLPSRVQTTIDASLSGISGTEALLARSSGVLAALSSGVGLAVGAMAAGDVLEHVHFTRLAERRVLAVVVGRSGTVRDRLLAVQEDLAAGQLEAAANFLNEHFRGWQLERVRAELLRRIERERTAYQQMMEAAERLWSGAVPAEAALSGERSVFVEGVANMVGLREDRARLRELLAALEAKQRVAELLAAYIDARQESVRVVFGIEEQAPELAGLVLVAAPARLPGSLHGTIGVLGPTRMDYGATMGAVSYVAQLFERVLEGGQGRS